MNERKRQQLQAAAAKALARLPARIEIPPLELTHALIQAARDFPMSREELAAPSRAQRRTKSRLTSR